MTLEIRQMVIKSDIANTNGKPAPGPADDETDGSGCDDGRSGAEALRSGLAAELERLRER
ncbi:DUF5908 family protein [Fulvimonas sp. R45]|uniref:DUF5908 family protein n=1 Tax=Fulvimonas sp. R45 TaxID=3045937 RepID=UPI00265E1A9E|nr:DUF5908 family protein [Fulvimonas sp. R45]MDO1529045.1 DUF5908 family protein [Fulvimonas sp. R45]